MKNKQTEDKTTDIRRRKEFKMSEPPWH